jgi:hypothetical protein
VERTLLSAAFGVDLGLASVFGLASGLLLVRNKSRASPKSKAADKSVRPTRVWESRSLPALNQRPRSEMSVAFSAFKMA